MKSTDSAETPREAESSPMVFCRHCLLEIPKGALVCTLCKQHQSRIRSWIAALSATAAAITVVGAALSYIITSAPEVRKAISWKDSIEVLQYSSRTGMIVANTGDGPIHLSHIRLTAKKPDSTHLFIRTIQVSQVVEPGKYSMTEGDDAKRQSKLRMPVMTHDKDEEFDAAIRDSGEITEVEAGKRCFLRVVYSNTDPIFQTYRDRMSNQLRSYPVTAQLHFYSLTTKRAFEVNIPVVGMLSMNDIERCRNLYIKSDTK